MIDEKNLTLVETVEEQPNPQPEVQEGPAENFFALAKDTLGNVVKVYPKALTRSQNRTLRGMGMDPTFWEDKRVVVKMQNVDPNDTEAMTRAYLEAGEAMDALTRKNADFVDAVLDVAYAEFNFDDTPQPDCNQLATLTYQLTQGRASAVKNS